MIYSITQNPLIRVLDIYGRDFASHPQTPMPPIVGPKVGQPRSSEELALEKGFSSVSDMLCRIAEAELDSFAQSAALRRWYYTDGSKGGILALIKAQYQFFGPEI